MSQIFFFIIYSVTCIMQGKKSVTNLTDYIPVFIYPEIN